MVRLRMMRVGAKKRPFYRIVAAHSESPRNGRFLEVVGHYDPLTNPPKIDFDNEKVSYWVKSGAVPTDTVRVLMKKAGVKASES